MLIYVCNQERETTKHKKVSQKKLKKTLDKLKKMCYNKYVIKRNENLFDK
jgi:hypothetical protein